MADRETAAEAKRAGMKDLPDDTKGFDGRMLEQRVARLEDDMKDIKSILARIEQRFSGIEQRVSGIEQRLSGIETELKHLAKATDVAELRGRITNLPTTVQMLVMLITVWSVGTGMVFAVLRLAVK